MIKKILSFCLLIGLILPTTKGTEMTEVTTTEPLPELSFAHIVERGKETQASIVEQNLLSYMGRYDQLTARSGQIAEVLQLFLAHMIQAQQPHEGYDIILEDIRAHPDAAERASQLLKMEELIGLINSGNLSAETLTSVKTILDQRKQSDLAIRSGAIIQRVMNSKTLQKMNADLLVRLKTAFENDLEKLRQYRNEETVSKWKLESPLPTSAEPAAAAPTIETPLPILEDVVRGYIALTQTIAAEEVSYLQENIALLTGNRDQLAVILHEARALEETPSRDEMIRALEKDIAETSEFIVRDEQRLEKLNAPGQQK